MKKVLIVTLASCFIFVLGTAILAAPAYTYTNDGTDPHGTGCDSVVSSPYQANIHYINSKGTLELRFSATCSTAWARFTCSQFIGCGNYGLYVKRNNDGLAERVNVSYPEDTNNGDYLYTLQVFDGSGLSAKACFYDNNSQTTVCTSSF